MATTPIPVNLHITTFVTFESQSSKLIIAFITDTTSLITTPVASVCIMGVQNERPDYANNLTELAQEYYDNKATVRKELEELRKDVSDIKASLARIESMMSALFVQRRGSVTSNSAGSGALSPVSVMSDEETEYHNRAAEMEGGGTGTFRRFDNMGGSVLKKSNK